MNCGTFGTYESCRTCGTGETCKTGGTCRTGECEPKLAKASAGDVGAIMGV